MSFAEFNPYQKLESCPALATVFWRAPTYTLSTDDFSSGVFKHSKLTALGHRHICLQNPDNRQVLLYDIDHNDCFDRWRQVGLPAPTWIALNPTNGRGHYGYALESPVIGFASRESKATKWLTAIHTAMQCALNADPLYTQRLTKNPLHPFWYTYTHDVIYSLEELGEYVPKTLFKLRAQPDERHLIEGRNSGLFFDLRKNMMNQWGFIWRLPEPEAINYVEMEAIRISSEINKLNPLPLSEIRQVSRSVSRWLQSHYSPLIFQRKFSEKQRRRQRKSSQKRKESTQEKLRIAIQTLLSQRVKLTVELVASRAGCSRQAIYKFHPEMLEFIRQPSW